MMNTEMKRKIYSSHLSECHNSRGCIDVIYTHVYDAAIKLSI